MVILLTLFSFGIYLPIWFGQTWSELKRIVRDPGMSPIWHSLYLFVPLYNLDRIHAHFRTINAQSAPRAMPRKMAPWIAVTVALVAIFVQRTSGSAYDSVTALVIIAVAALLLGAVFAIGQSELNSLWERDFGAASERKPSTGEWIALIVLGALFLFVWLGEDTLRALKSVSR